MPKRYIEYGKAVRYAANVGKAADKCIDAHSAVQALIRWAGTNWQGKSGAAFVTALEEWDTRLKTTISQLETLESEMRQDARTMLDTWPESKSEDVATGAVNAALSAAGIAGGLI